MEDRHLQYAKDLMEDYPEETRGFTVEEVVEIWEDFSRTLAAGWIIPGGENVGAIFREARLSRKRMPDKIVCPECGHIIYLPK